MLYKYFQVSIVRIQLLFLVAADVASQFGWRLVYAPTGKRFFQDHLPAAGVDGFPEVQRARFVKAIHDGAALIVKTQSREQAEGSNDRDAHADQAQLPAMRNENQNSNAHRE